jgi:putative transposase
VKIQIDNGPEFIAHTANDWSQIYNIEFKYIQPEKPTQNGFRERYNDSHLRCVLNKHIFENINQVRELTQIWMQDYNHYRPHDALGTSLRRIKNNNFIEVL